MYTKTIKRFITIAASAVLTLACAAGGAFAELKDNNNGTITDTATNLVWLKNANCYGTRNWQTAMNYAAALSSGVCGLNDKSHIGQWRLPTKEELMVRATDKTGFTTSRPLTIIGPPVSSQAAAPMPMACSWTAPLATTIKAITNMYGPFVEDSRLFG